MQFSSLVTLFAAASMAMAQATTAADGSLVTSTITSTIFQTSTSTIVVKYANPTAGTASPSGTSTNAKPVSANNGTFATGQNPSVNYNSGASSLTGSVVVSLAGLSAVVVALL